MTTGWRASWGLAGALLLLAGCTQAPEGELRHIQDDQYQIANPSKVHASATGIGCGVNEKDALHTAERIATYNLRSVTGPARYEVSYRELRRVPDERLICVEVEAQASP